MDTMTKSELLAIPVMEKRIRRNEQRLEYLRTKAEGSAIQLHERVQTSNDNKSQAILDAAIDLAIEIEGDKAELAYMKSLASEFIYSLQKSEDREMMILRYLRGLTWREVAEVMMYTQRTIEKRHEKILSSI